MQNFLDATRCHHNLTRFSLNGGIAPLSRPLSSICQLSPERKEVAIRAFHRRTVHLLHEKE